MSHVMKILLRIILDRNDIRIEEEISENQSGSGFRHQKGTREGIFNLKTIIERYLEVHNLRFADDTALLAETEGELQKIVDKVNEESAKKGLKMNVKKTKTMVVSRDEIPSVKIKVNGQILEQVKNFKYLGQIITDDGRNEKVVKACIEIARSNFI